MKALIVTDTSHRKAEILKVRVRTTYAVLVEALVMVGRKHEDELRDEVSRIELENYKKKVEEGVKVREGEVSYDNRV